MTSVVLALNAGSSTLKFGAFRREGGREVELIAGTVKSPDAGHEERLTKILSLVSSAVGAEPDVVAHRMVHGGPDLTAPCVINDAVMEQLERASELAPLHLPPALELLRVARARLPRRPHVATFDTAFHRHLPAFAQHFPLPPSFYERGVRRYGFHGLSCEYALSVLGSPPPRRVIVAHLGSGASLTAVLAGRSVDTTMSFTPTGGIPMGSRPGDLDPGLLIYLLRHTALTLDDLEDLMNRRAGLKGLADSSDMAQLLERTDSAATLAVTLFCYAIKKQIGAYAAALGGLDCVVLTGGIGERAVEVRRRTLEGLEFLGIELAPELNAASASIISAETSRVAVRVIVANEALMIARGAWHVLGV